MYKGKWVNEFFYAVQHMGTVCGECARAVCRSIEIKVTRATCAV